MSVWYRVRDMAAARAFYQDVLGFEERYSDEDGRWARLRREDMEIALWEAQGDEGGVASSPFPTCARRSTGCALEGWRSA